MRAQDAGRGGLNDGGGGALDVVLPAEGTWTHLDDRLVQDAHYPTAFEPSGWRSKDVTASAPSFRVSAALSDEVRVSAPTRSARGSPEASAVERGQRALQRPAPQAVVILQCPSLCGSPAPSLVVLHPGAPQRHSQRSPPRIGRRRILPWTGTGTGDVGRGGRNRNARCGRAVL